MTFRALSIIQPWPWLILRPDVEGASVRATLRAGGQMKDIENRTWPTAERGWVLVHASASRLAKWHHQEVELFAAKRGVQIPHRDSHVYGAVVGAMRIDDCVRFSRSPWFVQAFSDSRGFVIGAAVPFAAPVACAGTLKFFRLPRPDAGIDSSLGAHLAREIRAAGLAAAFGVGEAA